MTLLLQGVNTARPAFRDIDFLFCQQAHQFGTGCPVFQRQIAMRADRIPDGIDILDVIRVLIGLQGPHPDARAPITPPADFAFQLFIDQDAGTLFLHLFVRDMLAVIGQPGRTIVIRNAGQRTARYLAEHIRQLGNDILKVGDIVFIQFRAEAQIVITGIVKHAGQMGDVVFAGLAGFHTGQIFIAPAESAIDNLNTGRLGIGAKGIFPEGFGNDTAPAIETDLADCCQSPFIEGGLHTIGQTGGTDQTQETAPIQIAIQIAFAKAFIPCCVIHAYSPVQGWVHYWVSRGSNRRALWPCVGQSLHPAAADQR